MSDKLKNIAFAVFATGGNVEKALSIYGARRGWHVTDQQIVEAVKKGFRAGAGDSTMEVNFAAHNLRGLVRI